MKKERKMGLHIRTDVHAYTVHKIRLLFASIKITYLLT